MKATNAGRVPRRIRMLVGRGLLGQNPGVFPRSWRSRLALDLVALLLTAAAFLYGRQVTADLEWPGDPDMFRDWAVAQSLRDCWCLDDAHYKGELLWYNPLTAGVVAAISAVTDLPVHIVQVRGGAALNLIAPIGFYVMAVVVAGRLAALPALAAFLVLSTGRLFDTSSYSPWLMSPNFAQGVLYLAIAAYFTARTRTAAGWWLLAGGLAGLTVLGHTAAAIVLAAVIAVDLGVMLVQSSARASLLARAALLATTAVAVASPFLYAIVWHYRGRVLNAVPTVWIDRTMELERWVSFTTAHLARPHMALVAVGVVAAAITLGEGGRRRALGVWAATCLAFLVYGYAWQWQTAQGVTWPRILPEFHFLRLLDAAEHLAFGIGAAYVAERASRLVPAGRRDGLAAAAVVAVAIAAGLAAWPRYQQRHDPFAMRDSSLSMYRDPEQLRLREWLQTSSAPGDAFLADPAVSFSIVAPTGRRVVEVPVFFSNTFVSWSERHALAGAMWGALTNSNCDGLRELADRAGATHVIDEPSARWTRSIEAACGWRPVFASERWAIFARPH